jgi:hypothetical protein
MNIDVYLSTTGNTVLSNFPDGLVETANMPVCIAKGAMFCFGGDVEFFEHIMSKTFMGAAKMVHVDPEKRYVFVGENPEVEETGVVVYTNDGEGTGEYADQFFQRWKETQSMILQFYLYDNQRQPRFVILGFWNNGKWDLLESRTKGLFNVVDPRQTD